MGTKLFYLGIFLSLILPLFSTFGLPLVLVGVVVSAIGIVMIFLKR